LITQRGDVCPRLKIAEYAGEAKRKRAGLRAVRQISDASRVDSFLALRDNGAMRSIKIEARWSPEGWWARGIDESLYTQGDTLDELWKNIQEAVAVHFDDEPVQIQLLVTGHAPQETSASQ
jgi:predicted RNase H-like HicB family nuclease